MNIEKLKKSYKPNVSKFRRKWVNLFRDYSEKNRLQPSAIIVFTSFIISVIMIIGFGYEKYGSLPFLIGCFFILVSFIYFRFFPLSWEEMTEEEKEVYRTLNKLPSDWDLNK